MKQNLTYFAVILLLVSNLNYLNSQTNLSQVKNFGSNPGNLKLFVYDPQNITENAPLVIVLHGCTQTAESCAEQSGWNKLAKQNQFYVIYPEQSMQNNLQSCFNWYNQKDQKKDEGEPASIKQMVDFLKEYIMIDVSKIFIVGLSAGGGMCANLVAAYPETFNKVAIIGGGPFKSAESVLKAGPAMLGKVTKTPKEWGDLVRNINSNYSGKYPELAIFHSDKDPVVNSNNALQLIKQWTNLHQTDDKPDEHYKNFIGNPDVNLTIFKNKQLNEVVRFFSFKDLGHALAIDTGACESKGGKTGLFAKDKNFHTPYWAAQFFGIIKSNPIIKGKTEVTINSKNLSYSVDSFKDAKYIWKASNGLTIKTNVLANTISLDVANQSGMIEVFITDLSGCELGNCKLFINVK